MNTLPIIWWLFLQSISFYYKNYHAQRAGPRLVYIYIIADFNIVYIYNGTLMVAPRAYKPWVGRISCRCGTKVSSQNGYKASPWPKVKILNFHTRYWEPKPCRLSSPKRTISLQGLEQNPPQQVLTTPLSFISIFCLPWHFLFMISSANHATLLWSSELLPTIHYSSLSIVIVNVCLTCICNPWAIVLLLVSSSHWCIVLQPQ